VVLEQQDKAIMVAQEMVRMVHPDLVLVVAVQVQ
jgi:hypothetical protein